MRKKVYCPVTKRHILFALLKYITVSASAVAYIFLFISLVTGAFASQITAIAFACLAATISALCLAVYYDYSFRKINQALSASEKIDDPVAGSFSISKNLLSRISRLDSQSKDKYSYEILQKQAQMDAMQNQIQPHFLYNALESIRGLAMEESAGKTADMAESLAVLYRSSIGKPNDLLTLDQEIKNIENYVKIQQYRFGNRFSLVKDIQQNILDVMLIYKIPKLTLQPIVENSIYHGIDKLAEGGIIQINAHTTQSRLIISIKDNGQGMNDATLLGLNKNLIDIENKNASVGGGSESKNSGIALINVNNRIKLLFGSSYGLTVYSTEGIGTEVQVVLPLMDEDYERDFTG